jgi:dimeric dUTPase (all-alpha-NTP-PPase superfamily)
MKLDFNEISKLQRVLDDYIQDNNNLKPEDTFERRKVAFLVELGEFANEVRAFKF